jgi:hypothetical protein
MQHNLVDIPKIAAENTSYQLVGRTPGGTGVGSVKQKRLGLLTFIPALALMAVAILSLAPAFQRNKVSRSVAQSEPSAGKSLTLAQAWDVASERALYWHTDAKIVQLSTAHPDSDVSDGRDGRRAAWTARASSTSADAQLVMQIVDGEAGEAWENPSAGPEPALQRPIIDSPEAFKIASTSTAALTAGDQNRSAPGFSFTLAAGDDGKAEVIRVMGSIGDLSAYVETDATSGAIDARYQQDYGSNGALLYSDDAGKTWQASALVGLAVTGVAVDPSEGQVLFATIADSHGIQVHVSRDGGKDWGLLSTLPLDAGTYPQDIAVGSFQATGRTILVGTNSGLWTSNDEGKTWVQNVGLGRQPAWRIAVSRENGSDVALVSVVTGPDEGSLYASADLSAWVKRNTGVFRLSSMDAGNSVFAIDDSTGGNAFRLSGGTIGAVNVPVRRSTSADMDQGVQANGEYILRGTGSLNPGEGLVVQSQVAVYVSTDAGTSWRKTLEGSFASLGSSPTFSTDGVVIAGGYQSGIYRSTDSGLNWENVLPNPFSITPCSGIVSAVLFSSSTQVVALNTPTLIWRPL